MLNLSSHNSDVLRTSPCPIFNDSPSILRSDILSSRQGKDAREMLHIQTDHAPHSAFVPIHTIPVSEHCTGLRPKQRQWAQLAVHTEMPRFAHSANMDRLP
jgi:hypothetical protein